VCREIELALDADFFNPPARAGLGVDYGDAEVSNRTKLP
jgi:hypothetical protein